MRENKKLQARVVALEESRIPMNISQIMNRLDTVIQVVNTHVTDSYYLDQSAQDIQQELISSCQTFVPGMMIEKLTKKTNKRFPLMMMVRIC